MTVKQLVEILSEYIDDDKVNDGTRVVVLVARTKLRSDMLLGREEITSVSAKGVALGVDLASRETVIGITVSAADIEEGWNAGAGPYRSN